MTQHDRADVIDRICLQGLIDALSPYQGTINLPLLISLMMVARNEGLSVNELAEQVGIPQQTASRYVSVLSGRYEGTNISTDPLLSQVISTDDPRRRAMYLTDAGKQMLSRITGALVKAISNGENKDSVNERL